MVHATVEAGSGHSCNSRCDFLKESNSKALAVVLVLVPDKAKKSKEIFMAFRSGRLNNIIVL